MKSNFKITLFVACLLSVASCGGSGGGETATETMAEPQTQESGDTVQSTDSVATDVVDETETVGSGGSSAFVGTWTTDCLPEFTSTSDSDFERETLVFSEGQIAITNEFFLDSDCSVAADPAMITATGDITFPGGTVATSLGEAPIIEALFSTTAVDGVPVSDEQLALVEQFLGADAVLTDIFLIGSDGRLYGGDNRDSDNGGIPSTLNLDFSYRRL